MATAKKRLPPVDRRAQILDAAIALFSEEGFNGSTHTLAKTLGITQPLIYRYFPSKDELIREVYHSLYESRWKPEWEAILKDRSRDIRARLAAFYGVYTDVVFAREWMRVYLFSGLKGLDINRWWTHFVETRILTTICDELRHENAAETTAVRPPTPSELETLWSFQGSIFYYAMRRDLYQSRVHLPFEPFLAMMVEILLVSFKRAQEAGPPCGAGVAANPPIAPRARTRAKVVTRRP